MILTFDDSNYEDGDLPTSVSLSKTIFIKFPTKEAIPKNVGWDVIDITKPNVSCR